MGSIIGDEDTKELRPAAADQEEEDEQQCAICYLDVEELVQDALQAGKGGEDGQSVIFNCGKQACTTGK